MKRSIGTILKEMREKAGFTPKQVYDELGIKQSRFSAWECDKSEPPTEILLQLCELYGVTDILKEFGYDGYNEDGTLSLNLNECNLIEDYRKLTEPLQKEFRSLINLVSNICINESDESPVINLTANYNNDSEEDLLEEELDPKFLKAASGGENVDKETMEENFKLAREITRKHKKKKQEKENK